MKLKLPKTKKERRPVSSDARQIAKRFKKGYVAYRKRKAREMEEKYPGMPFPLSQKLQIELEGRGGAGGAEASSKTVEVREIIYRGIPIPAGLTHMKRLDIGLPEVIEELHRVNIKYPLIPAEPQRGETVFAYANIVWDEKVGSLVYNVIEPRLTESDKAIIEKIKRDIEERLDVNLSKIGEVRGKELLRQEVDKSLRAVPGMDPTKIAVFHYYIEKDIVGLSVIEPLMRDPEIEDISCDGERIPIYVYHRNPKFGSIRTNVWFDEKLELDGFVLKLAQRCGKSISIAEPLLDAALPDGSRVQCTMGTDIARRGSNFTIRKFTFYPLTPTHMLHYRTLDSMQLAYLWLAIDSGRSILISGGTATGKTSLLNALSLFIPPNLKILSIEDTPELRLPHMHWVPEVARSPLSVKGKIGEVTLFDLLKSSLRQRPDYLVVGEVRGKEAFVMFQQIATGHPSLSTIHAASLPQLVDRLITPPISLPPALIENIDIVVFLQRVKVKNKFVRRANEILEIIGLKDDRPNAVKIFEWNPAKDKFESRENSKVLEGIGRTTGITEESVQAEVLRRKRVLEWMHEKRIFDYNDVSRIVSSYSANPEKFMSLIEESG